MLIDITDNWLVFALLTPAAWALCCIIDVCMVGGGIYRGPMEGTAISSAFGALPLAIALPLVSFANLSVLACVVAVCAGVCFFAHIFFFFKALFALNDATSAETFNSLSVILVPIFAFILLGELLTPIDYFAVFIAAIGACALAFGHVLKENRKALKYSVLSVVFVSFTMVAQAHALEQMGYWPALAIFSASTLACAIVVTASSRQHRSSIIKLCQRFGLLFIFAELLQQGAVLSSQRAIAVGPSVSLVAVAECSLPLFIIVFSFFAVLLFRAGPRSTTKDALNEALREQITALPVKLVALVFIMSGISLMYFHNP